MTNLPKDLDSYSRDLVRRGSTVEGELLGNELASIPKARTVYDFRKEICWTNEQFTQLDRATLDKIAELYRTGLGTLVADHYARTRTWLPNNVIGKPGLMEWATKFRRTGTYRWLEVSYATAGGGTSVLTIRYRDKSYPGSLDQRWFQSMLHHSLGKGNWRKTVAIELWGMHRKAIRNRTNTMKLLAHDSRKLLR